MKKFKGEDFRVQRSGELLVLFIGLVGFEEIQGRTLGFLSPEEDEELKKIFAGHGRKEWIVEELESKDWIVEEFGGILIPPFCLRWKKIDILSCGGDVQVRMQFSEAMCTPHKYVDSTDFVVGSFFCCPRAQMVLNLYSLFCKNPAKGQIFVSQRF